jgi:hypothetical protein
MQEVSMNRFNKFLGATFLSAAMLFTSAAQDKGTKTAAIPVSTVVSQDKDKGTKIILDAFYNVAESLEHHLRLPVDSKGIQKSEARLRADNDTADRIHDIAAHYDPKMLMGIVFDAAQKTPDAELDDVIRAYLHAELDRQKAAPPAKEKKEKKN